MSWRSPIVPMLAFIQRAVLPVRTRYAVSTRPEGRTCTGFSSNRTWEYFHSRSVSLPHTSRRQRDWIQGLKAMVCPGMAGFTHCPRPRTRRALFNAPGANAELPFGWRPKGMGLGSPRRITRRAKRVAVQVAAALGTLRRVPRATASCRERSAASRFTCFASTCSCSAT